MLVVEVFGVFLDIPANVIVENFCKGKFKWIRRVIFLFILDLPLLMLTEPSVDPAFIVEVSF